MSETFGARLARLRRFAGFRSQRAFAAAVGVHSNTVAEWEGNWQCPSDQNLSKIAALIGVPALYIFTGDAGVLPAKRHDTNRPVWSIPSQDLLAEARVGRAEIERVEGFKRVMA